MQNVKNLNQAVHLDGDAMTRGVVASNRVVAHEHAGTETGRP